MKKAISPMMMFILLGFVTYEHKDYLVDHTKLLFHDPANYVLNANIPENDTIYSFFHDVHDTITLVAGLEKTYGFRHILARHTSTYFVNFPDKNKATQFTPNISGKDILLGIKDFYSHCVDVSIFNRRSERNIVYIGFAKLDGENIKCLLVVRQSDKAIVTFYPFTNTLDETTPDVRFD